MPIREYQTVFEDLVAEARTDPRFKADVDLNLAALAILGATNSGGTAGIGKAVRTVLRRSPPTFPGCW